MLGHRQSTLASALAAQAYQRIKQCSFTLGSSLRISTIFGVISALPTPAISIHPGGEAMTSFGQQVARRLIAMTHAGRSISSAPICRRVKYRPRWGRRYRPRHGRRAATDDTAATVLKLSAIITLRRNIRLASHHAGHMRIIDIIPSCSAKQRSETFGISLFSP